MSNLPKIMKSTATVRFQDCDPFNHLNNSKYIDYMVNAREDQIMEHYGLNIYQYAQETGMSWVVGSNQIAYLKPALLMEKVLIESQLLSYSEKELRVEVRMLNTDGTQLKALMWISFIAFNIATARIAEHEDRMMQLFEAVVHPIDNISNFESRIAQIRASQKKIK
ncbi:acyl-CoA thioesterase [Leptobacterium flavescens]|uniref:Acyl-CoA thioesterase n=2 Tax=Leptobacterium flavescens TaxID=472055 RepID=A0A6P0UN91_9FLAO|nr:acyl-CoA thioesterase [Leptobacterium flavescens]